MPNEIIVKFRAAVADAVQEQLQADSSAKALRLSPDLDRLNARYRAGRMEPLCKNFRDRRRQMKALGTKNPATLSKKEQQILRRLMRAPKSAKVPDLSGLYKIQLDLQSGQSLQQVIDAYQNCPGVEYAELNYIVSIDRIPDDPLYPNQWSLYNIAAPGAWDIHTGTSNVVVAVLDTGADYNHRDLKNNVWVNEAELNGTAGFDDDGNGYVDDVYGYDFINHDPDPKDDHGHGTHCSGIIAAEGNNGLDIAGVCWDARVMALKFLGSDGHGDIADAVGAVYYAVDNGADVLSNSWSGFSFYANALEDAFDYARSQGAISVAAAGNQASDQILYPAYFQSVISVAATDASNQRAFFSNYGEQVEIAAPGVDVLSLRASGTSMGTPYDSYTTIASGTSMACPHVSGAFALIFSLYPAIDADLAIDIIMQTTDQIAPDICNWGRLNLDNAIAIVAHFYAGTIRLDRDFYTCSDTVQIRLNDLNLVGLGASDVNVSTTAGDLETVTLTEVDPPSGAFFGTISTAPGEPIVKDGILQVSHDQLITATYLDEDDGTANPATVIDIAAADCQPPVISNIRVDPRGPEPIVTLDTNEPAMASVLCGLACGGPYTLVRSDSESETRHAIKLTGVLPETDYFFIIRAVDIAGNESIDDNAGRCYAFTTTGPSNIYVPHQFSTFQEAIDKSWDGSVVWVANGVYTGEGNRDIDFKARAITLRSENGPQKCVIDCQGTTTDPHYGFFFKRGESQSSVLAGFTIRNGYDTTFARGGAITCLESSPTIANCIITENTAAYGGAIACKMSSPTIVNCVIKNNSATYGGAISSEYSSPTISGCVMTGNRARIGGGLHARRGSLKVINSTFTGNLAASVGAVYCWQAAETITNCIMWDNLAAGAAQVYSSTYPSYSCIQKWSKGGQGNINADPCFVSPGYWLEVNEPNLTPTTDGPPVIWVEGDYHLSSDSPCIDAADPNYPYQSDQRDIDDEPRVFGGRADMGTDEYVPVIDLPMKLTPQALNPRSNARWIKAHFLLPEGFTVEQVNADVPATLSLLGIEIESNYIEVFHNDDNLVAMEIAFDRAAFCGAASAEGTVRVVGLFTDGAYFRGTDTVKIINNTLLRLAALASYWLHAGCGPPHWCEGLDLDRDSVVNFVDFAMLGDCSVEIVKPQTP
ncbi:MAG TPA: S8 family serine peptidase [Sedimentisphaerales bacterium]|nr:S8 family serine peptidase [Sedimentisphaerales bacterium]